MRRRLKAVVPLALCFTLSYGGAPPTISNDADPLQTLVESERAFARASVEKGMRDAFLQFLAEDGVIFRPLPVLGKPWFEARPPAPGRLIWEPVYGDIARSADLGFTTGPWEFRPDDTTRTSSFGHYLSIWKRQQDGAWRVVLDVGIDHEKLASPPVSYFPVTGRATKATSNPIQLEQARQAILAAERELTSIASAIGVEATLAEFGTKDVRLYRDGAPPSVGSDSLRARLAAGKDVYRWMPHFAAVAASGDFGYAHGIAEIRDSAGVDSSTYVRIWKKGSGRDRKWRVAVDLEAPLPKAGS
jgi:ketosteroid isomerase-like protein